MRIRKNISFCARKLSDLFYDLSIFLKKQSTSLYPFTSINDLDRQISILLPNLLNSKTFYIEVGANIEASPSLYEKCFLYRSKQNIIENYALVSPSYKKGFVKLIFGNLFTTQSKTNKGSLEHARKGVIRKLPIRKLLGLPKDHVYNFFAPTTTLNSLIEMHSINNVDLLSLDVEGNELAILEGCSLEKGHIKNILVETSDCKTINDYLINSGYFLIKKLSGHDYLYSLL